MSDQRRVRFALEGFGMSRQGQGSKRITLTDDEVVVLSDLLWRWEQNGALDTLPYEHRGELVAILRLSGALDPTVDSAFSPRYREVVAAARARLAATFETDGRDSDLA